MQSRLATDRSPRFGPRRTRYLCFSLEQTMTMQLKKLKLNVSKCVFSPFFACTDITMSWTFLYRSSDCFNSSILRSYNIRHNVRLTAKTNKPTKKKPWIVHCDAWKVPSPRWLPSVIQLPFSSSALPHLVVEKGNISHRTVVQVVALAPWYSNTTAAAVSNWLYYILVWPDVWRMKGHTSSQAHVAPRQTKWTQHEGLFHKVSVPATGTETHTGAHSMLPWYHTKSAV